MKAVENEISAVSEFPLGHAVPALQQGDFGMGTLGWREAGSGFCVVLLHGISSGSTAWAKQLSDATLTSQFRLLAWDAPGYGESDALPNERAFATDYADALYAWLSGLGIKSVLLVGHSLGAMMASAFAVRYPHLAVGIVLADPAQGYALASEQKRQEVYQLRESQINTLGAMGYAERRAANLLWENALPDDVAQVKYGMSRLRAEGFCCAAWMLANDDIHGYLANLSGPMEVWCGEQDGITPPDGAKTLAERYNASFILLPKAGHASYLDASAAFNHRLVLFIHLVCTARNIALADGVATHWTESALHE